MPTDTLFLPAEVQIYISATDPNVRDKVEQTILEEIESGNYVIVNNQPTIVSAIVTVPKPDSDDVRLIPRDPKKYSCLIKCKINNKRRIFKIKMVLNYQWADLNFDMLVLIFGCHLAEIWMFKVR